jgi:hypothetical protein
LGPQKNSSQKNLERALKATDRWRDFSQSGTPGAAADQRRPDQLPRFSLTFTERAKFEKYFFPENLNGALIVEKSYHGCILGEGEPVSAPHSSLPKPLSSRSCCHAESQASPD